MWVKQCHTTHLEMVYTSFKNGDLGDGLLLLVVMHSNMV
jgi:hypothetical protein